MIGPGKRFRIIVDQAAIADDKPAIHVHDTLTELRKNTRGPLRVVDALVFQGPPQQDGTRVWIEAANAFEVPL